MFKNLNWNDCLTILLTIIVIIIPIIMYLLKHLFLLKAKKVLKELTLFINIVKFNIQKYKLVFILTLILILIFSTPNFRFELDVIKDISNVMLGIILGFFVELFIIEPLKIFKEEFSLYVKIKKDFTEGIFEHLQNLVNYCLDKNTNIYDENKSLDENLLKLKNKIKESENFNIPSNKNVKNELSILLDVADNRYYISQAEKGVSIKIVEESILEIYKIKENLLSENFYDIKFKFLDFFSMADDMKNEFKFLLSKLVEKYIHVYCLLIIKDNRSNEYAEKLQILEEIFDLDNKILHEKNILKNK